MIPTHISRVNPRSIYGQTSREPHGFIMKVRPFSRLPDAQTQSSMCGKPYHSINNQSKLLTKPHTDKEKPEAEADLSAISRVVAKPASQATQAWGTISLNSSSESRESRLGVIPNSSSEQREWGLGVNM